MGDTDKKSIGISEVILQFGVAIKTAAFKGYLTVTNTTGGHESSIIMAPK